MGEGGLGHQGLAESERGFLVVSGMDLFWERSHGWYQPWDEGRECHEGRDVALVPRSEFSLFVSVCVYIFFLTKPFPGLRALCLFSLQTKAFGQFEKNKIFYRKSSL